MILAERLRSALEATIVEYGGSKLSFTASFGVSGLPSPTALEAFDPEIVQRFEVMRSSVDADISGILYSIADRALYDAKASGRNRCKLADFSKLSELTDLFPSEL